MSLHHFETFKGLFQAFSHHIGFILLFANGIFILELEGVSTQEDLFNHVLKLPAGLEIKWKSGDPEWITFELRAPTNGYVGIGFSRDGGMSHSDIHIGWVDSSGQGHIKDLYSGSTTRDLFVDSSQDLELIKAVEKNNWTSIIFRRRWDTCDNMDVPITEDTMRLIWAWNDEDPVEFLDGTMKLLPYHEKDEMKRGGRSIFMKTKSSSSLKLFPDEEPMYPEDVKHFDFSVSNIRVPKADSYHHCRIVKFPTLARKHHVIAYRPLMEVRSNYLYQMNLYRCDSVGSTVFEKYVDYPGQDCYEEESSIEWYTHCTELRVSLSVGAEGEIFPEHFGQPISSKDTFYLLETHYENPEGDYVVDNSGVRVFFSSKLREFDMGLMIVGHRLSPFLSVPPRQKDFTLSSLCSDECTFNGLRPEGIRVVSILLRTHLTGRAISLRHIRKGKELPVISNDKNLDYKYQSFRRLQKEVTVLPGDQLITECTFDTSMNASFIYGGISPRSETCEAVLVYYPKSALMDCRSEPELFSYLEPLGVGNVTNNDPVSGDLTLNSIIEERMWNEMSKGAPGSQFKQILLKSPRGIRAVFLSDFLQSLDWSNDYFTKLTEQKWRYGKQSVYCYGLHGQRINTTKVVEFPVFMEKIPMTLPETSCFAKLAMSRASLVHSFFSRLNYYLFICFAYIVFT